MDWCNGEYCNYTYNLPTSISLGSRSMALSSLSSPLKLSLSAEQLSCSKIHLLMYDRPPDKQSNGVSKKSQYCRPQQEGSQIIRAFLRLIAYMRRLYGSSAIKLNMVLDSTKNPDASLCRIRTQNHHYFCLCQLEMSNNVSRWLSPFTILQVAMILVTKRR